jgi:hypothetical protein
MERIMCWMAISTMFFGGLDLLLYRDDIVTWLNK